MDNVTHSLIGVVLGSVALKMAPRVSEIPKARKLVLWTAILSNNAPDIDVFTHRLFGTGRLAALLQHRGYTHTFLAVPVLAVLSLLVAWLLSGIPRMHRRWWWGFLGLSVVGVCCHLGADYWNDYGIHPFSPFNNHWYYGDSVFIVEPLIWFSILPLAFFESKAFWLKSVTVLLTLFMAGLLAFGPFVPAYVTASALLWLVIAFLWQKWFNGGQYNCVPAVMLLSLVITSFFVGSHRVEAQISRLVSNSNSREQIVQLIRSPAPADPLCWKVITVSFKSSDASQKDPLDLYIIRMGTMSLLPKFISAQSCLRALDAASTADLLPVSLSARTSDGSEIQWQGEYRRSRSELAHLDTQFCQFKALREFARAPFWANDQEGWIAGDFRFDRGRGGGFARVRFATAHDDTPCPSYLPGWDPPVPQ
jgi:inner membrane protein